MITPALARRPARRLGGDAAWLLGLVAGARVRVRRRVILSTWQSSTQGTRFTGTFGTDQSSTDGTEGSVRPMAQPLAAPVSSKSSPLGQTGGLTRLLLVCGILAGPIYVTVGLVQARTRPGF